MSLYHCVLIAIIGCAVYSTAQGQEASCELMDPAAMQLRICELQRQVDEMKTLIMLNGVLAPENINGNDMLQESIGDMKQKRKNEFIRFGKRKNEFIRFGKRKNEFIRFGRSDGGNPDAASMTEQLVAKRKNEFIRFG